jgi:hypothetical protein
MAPTEAEVGEFIRRSDPIGTFLAADSIPGRRGRSEWFRWETVEFARSDHGGAA